MAEIDALKAKTYRIPFIDPIDSLRSVRSHAEAGSGGDVLPDGRVGLDDRNIAKRFCMLLCVFLKGRYRLVGIVLIRHTDRAEEVDEETFFHGPASGGTMVSSGLQAMQDGVRSRSRSRDDPAGQLVFAYLEVGESGGHTFDLSDSSLWSLYQRLRNEGEPLSMREASDHSEIFPVLKVNAGAATP
jgi:uncharacterized protein